MATRAVGVETGRAKVRSRRDGEAATDSYAAAAELEATTAVRAFLLGGASGLSASGGALGEVTLGEGGLGGATAGTVAGRWAAFA